MTSSSILTEALEQRLFLSASRTAAVADFNGDGKADMVSLDIRSSRQQGTLILGFRAGNGDGTFASPVQMAVPVYFDAKDPLFLLSGNFSGGTAADLIIVEGEGQVASGGIPGGGCIVTLSGNGDGTFIAGQPLPFSTAFTDVVAGDVNGDGLADLLFLSPAADHAGPQYHRVSQRRAGRILPATGQRTSPSRQRRRRHAGRSQRRWQGRPRGRDGRQQCRPSPRSTETATEPLPCRITPMCCPA